MGQDHGVVSSGRWKRAARVLVAAIGLVCAAAAASAEFLQTQPGQDPLQLIKALRDEGRIAEALEAATEALRNEPERRDLRAERGFLLGSVGRYDEALAEFEAILADNPGDVEALLEHAQVKLLQGKSDEAEGEFRFLLALAPGLPGATFGLGDVLAGRGDVAGAREAYRQYVRARPDDPLGHLRLGNLALQAGEAREARDRFREALRLAPANADARAGSERAEGLLAREYRFRFELGYAHETLTNGQPDWRAGSMLLLFRPWRGTELSAGAQAVNRFGENDQLASIGVAQDIFGVFNLSGSFSQGFNNGRLLPKRSYEGQLAVRGPLGSQVFTSYTFSEFNEGVTAGTLSPGVQVAFPWGLSVLGRYFRTESTANEPANAFLVQVSHDTSPRFQPYLGAAHGGLAGGALVTTAELRNANAQYNSFFAGFSWRILSHFGIRADYAVQAVKHVYVKHTFGLTTFLEF